MEVYRRSSGLLLLLGFALLATTLQGVQGEVESEGPSESECRPYIEKALKELEAGEAVVGSSEAVDSSKEDIPTVEITDDSEHQEGEGDDNDSNEDRPGSKESQENVQETVSETKSEPEVRKTMFQIITNRISQFFQRTPVNKTKEAAIEEKSTDKEADDSQEHPEKASTEDDSKSDETATKDDSKEDGKSGEHDSVEATADDGESEEGDDKETTEEEEQQESKEAQEVSKEGDESKEEEQAESVEEADADNKEEPVEDKEGSEEQAGESVEESAEKKVESEGESKEEEAVQETAESVEGGVQVPDESKEQTESKEDAEEGDSKEEASDGDSKDVEQGESKEEESQKDDSKEEPDDSKGEASVEKSKEDEQDDGDSKEDKPDQEESQEQAESVEEKTESKEGADDDQSEAADSKEDQQKSESVEDKQESGEDEKKESGEDKDETAEDKTDSKEDTDDEKVSKEEEKSGENKSIEKREAGDEPDDDDSKDKVVELEDARKFIHDADDDSEEIATTSTEGDAGPVEELSGDIEIPSELRSRDHVEHLLKLDEESSETENVINRVNEVTLKELKKLYENAIKPLETLYKYRDLSNRHFGDSEIFSKPLILFMGPWSGGKSSIINYLVNIEYNETALRTGAEPSPAYFNILMYGDESEVLDGTELAADFTFSGLQKFGQGLEERLRGLKVPSSILEKVNIVEIPGILEVRKQVSRVFPFNDACQWFIDRADIIFLVYDPSKLDVGPETEAILDQLKGREHQTRIILNKADQVKPEELMRVQGALIWNISPLMSSPQPPVMYTTSLWSKPFEPWAPTKLLQAQERAFLRDLRGAIVKRIENKIASARRFAVRVRNHAKMVDCYLTTYYNHKSVFGNRKQVADEIIDHPQDYHIYEGLSTLTNISRYDLPDPEVYRDFFKLNPLYEFQQLSATCTYFRGCPINRLDIAIAYDLPELVGTHKKLIENALAEAANQSPSTPGS